jgi:hypothetical protein
MICIPIGRPSSVQPTGMLAAGLPVRLNGLVNEGAGRSEVTATPATSRGPKCVTSKATVGVVGVSSRS